MRQAATGGTKSTPRDPTDVPKPSGGGTGEGGTPEPGPIPIPGADVLDDWVDFFGEAAKTYAHLATDVATRAVSGDYKAADFAKDTARYWSQLARDWAQAWAFGIDLVQTVGDEGTTLVPPPPERTKAPEPGKAPDSTSRARVRRGDRYRGRQCRPGPGPGDRRHPDLGPGGR